MGPLRSENGGRAIRTVDAFLPWSIGEARRATLKGLMGLPLDRRFRATRMVRPNGA